MDPALTTNTEESGLRGVVPFRFACHRCARCCTVGRGHVWLEPEELPRLADALGMSAARFADRYVRRVLDARGGAWRLSLREDGSDGGRCALLVGSNECSVYAARPEHCRTFPYWSTVLTDRAAFASAREVCPGIAVEVDRGLRERAFARLESLHAEVDGFVRARGVDPSTRLGGCRARGRDSSIADTDAEPYATALEVDFHRHKMSVAGSVGARGGCAEQGACTLACRLAPLRAPEAYEHFLGRLRSIESEMDYPRSYGEFRLMLAAREERERMSAGPGPCVRSDA